MIDGETQESLFNNYIKTYKLTFEKNAVNEQLMKYLISNIIFPTSKN